MAPTATCARGNTTSIVRERSGLAGSRSRGRDGGPYRPKIGVLPTEILSRFSVYRLGGGVSVEIKRKGKKGRMGMGLGAVAC